MAVFHLGPFSLVLFPSSLPLLLGLRSGLGLGRGIVVHLVFPHGIVLACRSPGSSISPSLPSLPSLPPSLLPSLLSTCLSPFQVLSSDARNDAIHKYAPKDFHIKCQFCLKSFNGRYPPFPFPISSFSPSLLPCLPSLLPLPLPLYRPCSALFLSFLPFLPSSFSCLPSLLPFPFLFVVHAQLFSFPSFLSSLPHFPASLPSFPLPWQAKTPFAILNYTRFFGNSTSPIPPSFFPVLRLIRRCLPFHPFAPPSSLPPSLPHLGLIFLF